MNTHYLSAAGFDYLATSRPLTFNNRSRQSVFVPIINDELFENPENFSGHLSAASVLPPNVCLNPTEATATLIDDRLNPTEATAAIIDDERELNNNILNNVDIIMIFSASLACNF